MAGTLVGTADSQYYLVILKMEEASNATSPCRLLKSDVR